MSVDREIKEGTQEQGEDEEIVYSLTTTPWGSSPTSVSVKAYDITTNDFTDVSSTVLVGSATVSGDVISTPIVYNLTEGNTYRLEIKFTSSGNVFEPYAIIECKR